MQSVPTGLTLARFAKLMGINPVHFWGFDLSTLSTTAGQGPACGGAWFQYDWQSAEKLSRDSLARAIASAEAELEELVGYNLIPKWIANEYSQTTRPFRPETFNINSRNLRGFQQSVPSRRGFGVAGGVRGYTLYQAAQPIVYSNTQPPAAFLNLATVALDIPSAPAPCEVAVFYPGHGGDEQWRIQPITVVQNVQHYTITFEAQMGIVEDFLNTYDLEELRGAEAVDPGNFIDSVDVGRVYNDISQQALLLWEPSGGCSFTGSNGFAFGSPGNLWDGWLAQTGVILPRGDTRLPQWAYQPATYDPATAAWGRAASCCNFREPDMVRLSYYSGYRDERRACPDLDMAEEWAYVVAAYAATKCERPPCACAQAFFKYWQTDLAFQGGVDQLSTYQLSQSDIANPLGTRRGAINAWHMVNRPGIAIGRVAVDGR